MDGRKRIQGTFSWDKWAGLFYPLFYCVFCLFFSFAVCLFVHWDVNMGGFTALSFLFFLIRGFCIILLFTFHISVQVGKWRACRHCTWVLSRRQRTEIMTVLSQQLGLIISRHDEGESNEQLSHLYFISF
ncbi:hypothetical protein B0H63DRAFT_105279 [Podospora didyma]|uniref:Uncharacterized protein n=1 Tax=Podospora didyma TaxID=330526 RepID=A0AAE0U439_9PEZI|nr:hypothetical protein B0H63DRAFT_105279 [Podospora didyma]